MRSFLSWSSLAAGLLVALTSAAPSQHPSLVARADEKLAFAHFMIGIVSDRTSAAAYDDDMKRAKAGGIDAFALNIGTDSYTTAQLNYAYESAANNDMKVFISFDFNWYRPDSDAATVGNLIKEFGSKPAQLTVDGKVFVSSFIGDGLNVDQVRETSGMDLFFIPNFAPSLTPSPDSIDGAFNWMAWDSDGNNKAPKPGSTVTVSQGDQTYLSWLNGKPYMAPVSPWFSTHYGPEVSYSKNWVFPSDLLWYNRWNEILELSPPYLEIITWNDYGESHYIGPLASKHTDDGNSKWVNDMPHNGWLDMAKPFIAAYKAGDKSVENHIQQDQLIYWYRPTLKTLDCDATDTTMQDADNSTGNYFKGRPDGSDSMQDAVFVVALLTSPGQVTAVSGGNSKTFDAPAGASAWQVDMAVGQQKFSLERDGQTVMSEISLRDVSDVCPCGLYNFNAFVGTVPAGEIDVLSPDALASLTVGLHVTTCEPKPTYTTVPSGGVIPTGGASSAVTTAPGTPETTVSPTPTPTSAPNTSASQPVSSATPPASTTNGGGAGGCTQTITASSQIFPTNCLQGGQVWAGPNQWPDCCDGVTPCCKQ